MNIPDEHKRLLLIDELVNTPVIENIENLTLAQLLKIKIEGYKDEGKNVPAYIG